jgi:hypothetical protein
MSDAIKKSKIKPVSIEELIDNPLFKYQFNLNFDVATFYPVETRLHLEKYVSAFIEELKKDSKYVFANIQLNLNEVE